MNLVGRWNVRRNSLRQVEWSEDTDESEEDYGDLPSWEATIEDLKYESHG